MYRKGVSALIMNSNDEFLLVNLESFENKYFAVPGGGVEQGETFEDAVYREVHEELGIEKSSLRLAGKSPVPVRFKFKVITMNRDSKTYEGSERYFFGFCFVGNNSEIRPRKGEVRACKWVPFGQLKDHLLFDNQLQETSEKIVEIFPKVLQLHKVVDRFC